MRRPGPGVQRSAFILAALAASAPAVAQDNQVEVEVWPTVSARNRPSDYEGYLRLYPNGRFGPLARLRLEQAPAPAPVLAPPPAAAQPPRSGEVNLYRLDARACGAGRHARSHPGRRFGRQRRRRQVPGARRQFQGRLFPFPLPPGRTSYVSRQYNPEGRMEVMARSPLTIR